MCRHRTNDEVIDCCGLSNTVFELELFRSYHKWCRAALYFCYVPHCFPSILLTCWRWRGSEWLINKKAGQESFRRIQSLAVGATNIITLVRFSSNKAKRSCMRLYQNVHVEIDGFKVESNKKVTIGKRRTRLEIRALE